MTSACGYDTANRLLSVTHSKGATTVFTASYTLDAVGNRTQKATAAGTESYTLDMLNRLTSVSYPAGGGTTNYTYDAAGNRATMQTSTGTTSYAYDNASQLTSVTPPGQGAQTNNYDLNGNQTGRNGDSFTWDVANRLTSATVGGQVEGNVYNGDGLRTSRTAGGTTKSYVWDVQAKLPQVLDDGTQCIYGAGLVSQVTASGTVYYLADGLGSTVAIVDGSGTVVQNYSYDVYGAVKSSTGSQASDVQFAGQQTDPNGLQYLRARYYDASTGRFLSRDPLHSAAPTRFPAYRYGSNNPASNTDPSGLDAVPPGGMLTPPAPYDPANPPANPIGRCVDGYACWVFYTPSGPVLVNIPTADLANHHDQMIAGGQATAQAISDRLQDIASGRFGFAYGGPPLRSQSWTFFVVWQDIPIDPCAGHLGCAAFGSDPFFRNSIWVRVDRNPNVYWTASHEVGHAVFGGDEVHCSWDAGYACYPSPNGSPPCAPTPGQGLVGPPLHACQ